MKKTQQVLQEIQKYKSYVIIVEGKNDKKAISNLGFEKIFTLHKNSISLRERAEQICNQIEKKDKVCILTDFDKKGRQLYKYVKPILQENGIRLDSSLRKILKANSVSHIEGIKIEND